VSHDHGLPGQGHRRPLALVLTISSVILVVEVVGAFVSGSLALLADAGHMLTDVAGLTLALVAAVLAGRPATDARTWGYRRAEVLAAAGQAAVLLAVGGFVLIEGVERLFAPPGLDGVEPRSTARLRHRLSLKRHHRLRLLWRHPRGGDRADLRHQPIHDIPQIT